MNREDDIVTKQSDVRAGRVGFAELGEILTKAVGPPRWGCRQGQQRLEDNNGNQLPMEQGGRLEDNAEWFTMVGAGSRMGERCRLSVKHRTPPPKKAGIVTTRTIKVSSR